MQCMASKPSRNTRRSNGKKRKNKIEPAVMTLNFVTDPTDPNQTTQYFIDLSQVASLVNRRFYRQGINWAVAGFKVYTATPPSGSKISGQVVIEKLPNTWVMSNAWEKSMRTWLRMSNEALEENESARPRFMDFKVFADADHHQAGVAGNLLPFSYGGFAIPGEWDYSTIQVPDPTDLVAGTDRRAVNEYDLIATGPSYPGVSPVTGNDAASLIEGYAASRALPAVPSDPNTPDDMRDADSVTPENWMTALFNEGLTQSSEILEDLQTQNVSAPYPFENDGVNVDTHYPGGANQMPGLEIHDLSNISATTVGGNTYFKGGNFPCGLIKIQHGVDPESIAHGIGIIIDLVPGDHRGYLCEPMTEM
jgi:hypothetical protein